MARKQKTGESKLAAAAALLKKLEERTARAVKGRLGGGWRDNLFEILMTRLELAAPQKKTYAAIPEALCREPEAAPRFARLFCKTMHNILVMAKAPASPLHVAAFSVLYASVVNVFLSDPTKDHAKTMAALDQRLGWFEQLAEVMPCPLKRQADHRA